MNHQIRWGASIIEEFREDGSIARRVYERPSVRPETPVFTEPVPRTFGDILELLAAGTIAGIFMWLAVVGLFVVAS